jgi:hypothetical protein
MITLPCAGARHPGDRRHGSRRRRVLRFSFDPQVGGFIPPGAAGRARLGRGSVRFRGRLTKPDRLRVDGQLRQRDRFRDPALEERRELVSARLARRQHDVVFRHDGAVSKQAVLLPGARRQRRRCVRVVEHGEREDAPEMNRGAGFPPLRHTPRPPNSVGRVLSTSAPRSPSPPETPELPRAVPGRRPLWRTAR